jgi:hypothetical protein
MATEYTEFHCCIFTAEDAEKQMSDYTQRVPKTYREVTMYTISLRLPTSLHKSARELAQQDEISINQFITIALSEKISALNAGEYLQERAKKGSRNKFLRALAKVKDRKPEPYDSL